MWWWEAGGEFPTMVLFLFLFPVPTLHIAMPHLPAPFYPRAGTCSQPARPRGFLVVWGRRDVKTTRPAVVRAMNNAGAWW